MRPRSPSGSATDSADLAPLQITHVTPADAMREILRIDRAQALPAVPTVQPTEGVTGDCATADRPSDAVHTVPHHRSDINTGGLFAAAPKPGHGVHAAVGRDAA
jgi:hypothetical protein